MIKLNKIILILSGILILAFFLRFYQLSSVPPSASLDEASIGWNAYSILQTGKDEYGNTFPILLRAYDDWRPALYVYFVIPFIKLFELNVLSVRLPSVIFSVLTIAATYFLVKELFKVKPREFPDFFNGNNLGLGTAFLLAISPWHIYISRLGHEVNLGLSFLVFAVLFFLKRRIYLSTAFFILSLISYQTEKVFIPVLLLGIFFIFKSEILKIKEKIAFTVLISLLILIPFVKASLSQEALIRFSGTNVFNANEHRFIEQSLLLKKATSENDLIGRIIYNRRILSLQIFSEGYLSHFDPVWLFTNALGDRHKVPGIGLLYVWELPFILLGMYILIRNKFDIKTKSLLFLWFLASPIAASLATDSPQALRTLVILPTWQIFSSLGLVYLFALFKSDKLKKSMWILAVFVIFMSLSFFIRQYFYVFPKTQSDSFQYTLSKAIPYAFQNQDKYQKVIFANNVNLSQSYMFFLFYTKYDPSLYQSQGGTVSGGYEAVHKFGKYEFRAIDIEKEQAENLYVGNYAQFYLKGKLVDQAKTLINVKNLNGDNTIKIVTK